MNYLLVSDMEEWYHDMINHGIPEKSAALMAAAFSIANTIDGLSHCIGDDRSLGALDLHTVHIEDALNNIAKSIEHIQEE